MEMKEYRDKLADHKLESQKEYQRILLGLSGGALTVSLTFIDGLISENGILLNLVLILGWTFLLITVFSLVYYYKKVTKSSDELISGAEQVINGKLTHDEFYAVYKIKTHELDILNRISSYLMFIGLLLLSIFFSANLIFKSPKKTNADAEPKNCTCKFQNPVHIENNPVFINNNNRADTNIIKKYYNCKPKDPCQ